LECLFKSLKIDWEYIRIFLRQWQSKSIFIWHIGIIKYCLQTIVDIPTQNLVIRDYHFNCLFRYRVIERNERLYLLILIGIGKLSARGFSSLCQDSNQLFSDYASESKFAALFISRKYGARSATMRGIPLLVNPVRFTRSCIERTF